MKRSALPSRLPRKARWPGVVEYVDDEVVSSDFITDPHTSIFDARAGLALNDTSSSSWLGTTNEWGFSNKMLDLTRHIDSVRKA